MKKIKKLEEEIKATEEYIKILQKDYEEKINYFTINNFTEETKTNAVLALEITIAREIGYLNGLRIAKDFINNE